MTSDVAGASTAVGEPVLTARGLVKRFPVVRWRGWRPERRVVHALGGVDLDLRAGECLGVVGESGSGKTTLVRCLARHET
ncbi:MAG: ATP-binding cassette domain-containing protein, partial [Acidobacteriota bacterium]